MATKKTTTSKAPAKATKAEAKTVKDIIDKFTYHFAPTIAGSAASGGTTAFTMTGNTGRDGGGVLGSLSNYCVTLDNYSLVVPIVKSDNGFSGGARNGNRNPLVAKFGYIKLS